MTFKIVAVTACVSGVAHTYMAAERLEALCKQKKWSVKIETQGALGVETPLTVEDINEADAVLLITDIELTDGNRFQDKPCIRTTTTVFLCEPQKILAEINKLISVK